MSTHVIILRFGPDVSEARKHELMTKHSLQIPEGDTAFFKGSAPEVERKIAGLRAEAGIVSAALGD
jgi:hypothetical protein